jgi:predicted aldo/keto reductase-like oxidoreductase
MKTRKFGKTNWLISELGYGMWGLVDWSGSDQNEVEKSLEMSVDLGCNFLIRLGDMEKEKASRYWANCYAGMRIKNYMVHRKYPLRILFGHPKEDSN